MKPTLLAVNLAGQDATYLTRQLKAFQESTRMHEQISIIAKILSDAQVPDVAAHCNAAQIKVIRVPGQ